MSDNDTCENLGSSIFSISEASGSSSSSQSANECGRRNSLFITKAVNGTFFKYLPEKSCLEQNRVVAVCVQCQPNIVEIKGYKNSSSNFISHLKRRHGNDAYTAFKKHMDSKGRGTIISRNLAIKIPVSSSQEAIQQQKFEEDITKYIIHSMIPLRTVEDPYFKAIFDNFNMSERGLTILSHHSIGCHIDSLFQKQMSEIRENLKHVLYVCTSADIWSGKRRSFLGVTAHWITTSLERKSVVLACRRFSSVHTFGRISDLLHEIYSDFGLTSTKIVATITDNRNNYTKSFKMNGIKQEHIDSPEESCGLGDNTEEQSDSDPDIDSNEEINLTQYENYVLPNLEQVLPTHLRCYAHILSLCVTTDATRVLREQSELSVLHSQVMEKCNTLWKAVRRPESSEIIENFLGYTLSTPVQTRWNSVYNSLKQILSIKEKCSQLFKVLNIKCMIKEQEFVYLEEHLTCIAPLAEALDLLQSETNTYYGIVLPCLLALQRKLRILTKRELIYCKTLIDTLLNSVETRFNEFFKFNTSESKNAVIAALSYPRFKNTWFLCVESLYHEQLLTLFRQATVAEIAPESPRSKDTEGLSLEDTFFDFGTPNTRHSSQLLSKVELQVLHYLGDEDQRLDILVRYPEIKKVFIKYNTPLPSSAPVKRFFSHSTMTNLPKLSDDTFEKRVVLKANLKSIA